MMYEVYFRSTVHGRCQIIFDNLENCKNWILSYDPDGEIGVSVHEITPEDNGLSITERIMTAQELWGIEPAKTLPVSKINWGNEGF